MCGFQHKFLVQEGDALNVILPLQNHPLAPQPHWSMENLVKKPRSIFKYFSGWWVNHTSEKPILLPIILTRLSLAEYMPLIYFVLSRRRWQLYRIYFKTFLMSNDWNGLYQRNIASHPFCVIIWPQAHSWGIEGIRLGETYCPSQIFLVLFLKISFSILKQKTMATKEASSKKWTIKHSRAVLTFENFLLEIYLSTDKL